jgi:hypothetical protein
MKKITDYTLFQDGDFDIKVIGIIKLVVYNCSTTGVKNYQKTIYRVDKIDVAKKIYLQISPVFDYSNFNCCGITIIRF